ncbi:hypothetical protein RIB2604_01505320 [Aspergillus luchuensis]|uniref:Clr5 domain-containing protein n=1 Tax=Aspergillus kawachii TaxID=1069201 RepID=A0A146F959_ASPKA|nr:hypothetical protein RIB2604_01505320 [Aspergillus luchuensis]
MERAKAYEKHRSLIFRLFVTEGLTHEQAKLEFEKLVLESRLTIYKNIRGESAADAQTILSQTPDDGHCLIFQNGVLQDNHDIAQHSRRKQKEPKKKKKATSSKTKRISLPFNITALSNPSTFRDFQYLLFATRIHFECSFDTGKWAPNHQGLYARSPDFQAQVMVLSKLHNRIFHALKHLREGQNDKAQELLQETFPLHRSVVRCSHHRQIPDILGILVMVWRSGNKKLQHSIRDDLVALAAQSLPQNDPRRLMLESLGRLDLDQIRPLYLAFDAYCRSLWMERASGSIIKAYISYNQAHFPRTDEGGFYSLYEGMTLGSIQNTLAQVDAELERYSHENMLLWHTAIQYLWSRRRYTEMSYICAHLSKRINQLGTDFDYTQNRQLNQDAATTFLLLGLSYEVLGYPYSARLEFEHAAQLRDKVISTDMWDPTRKAALDKWVEIDRRIGETHTATISSSLIKKMYRTGSSADERVPAPPATT